MSTVEYSNRDFDVRYGIMTLVYINFRHLAFSALIQHKFFIGRIFVFGIGSLRKQIFFCSLVI